MKIFRTAMKQVRKFFSSLNTVTQ